MTDISNPAVHGPYAQLITQPGYYYLYALYADFAADNAKHLSREYEVLLQRRLRAAQPLLGLVQPYRKSWALRLFTERKSLGRFQPEEVSEAWRQLGELIQRLGPPAGWPDRPPTEDGAQEAAVGQPEADARRSGSPASATAVGSGRAPAEKDEATQRTRFPKSPVDYDQTV